MPRLSAGGARRSSLWRRLRPRAPALALLALAALALGGILAPEAEAQTETEVWSGTVTVGVVSGTHGRGYLAAAHPMTVTGGTLSSDDDFDIGGTIYTVWRITIATNNTPHRPRFAVATGSTPAVADLPDKDELILRVTYGGEAGDFTLSDATYTDSSGDAASQGFHWGSSFGHPSGISPTIGGTMTVALLRTSTNTNTAAMGAPTITGTAQVGETLTAATTGITDADGLTSPGYTYQWIRANGSEVDIAGANSSTYTLDSADLGKTIKVKVSFTDDAGNAETLTSAATATVTADTTTPVSAALVSNLNQPATSGTLNIGSGAARFALAQGFTTGADSGGYTLTSIEIAFSSGFNSTQLGALTASVWTVDGSDNPDTELFTLTKPASIGEATTVGSDPVTVTGNYAVFTAPAGRTLDPSTQYQMVVAGDSATAVWSTPASGETGASGWSIANIARARQTSPNPGNWGAAHGTVRAMLIRVNGTTGGGTTTNTAPTVENAISDQTATVGTALLYAFPANTFNDADASDTLTYTATQSDDSALPAWLSFTAATRTFSGTPQAADVGTVSVKVTASDGSESVSDTFDIVVSAAPDTTPPEVESVAVFSTGEFITITFDEAMDTAVVGNVPFSAYSITADGENVPVTNYAAQGAAVRVSFIATPIRKGQTVVVSYTDPTAADDTDALQDLAGNDVASFTTGTSGVPAVTNGSNLNNAPTVATAIPNQTATAGTALLYAFPTNTFADTDTGDTLTYTATQSDDTALPAWLSFTAATRTFSGTPQAVDVGTVSVKVTASDGNGGSVSDTFDIVVGLPADTSPTLVSNVGQDEFGNAELVGDDLAQSFTTGTNATGYTLSSIELRLDSFVSTSTPTVKLYRGSANGTEVATLTGPAMLDTDTVKNYLITLESKLHLG